MWAAGRCWRRFAPATWTGSLAEPKAASPISAALGDTTAALHHLRAAAAGGWLYYRHAQVDPLLRSMGRNPEFRSLLAAVADSAAAMRRRIVGLAR